MGAAVVKHRARKRVAYEREPRAVHHDDHGRAVPGERGEQAAEVAPKPVARTWPESACVALDCEHSNILARAHRQGAFVPSATRTCTMAPCSFRTTPPSACMRRVAEYGSAPRILPTST